MKFVLGLVLAGTIGGSAFSLPVQEARLRVEASNNEKIIYWQSVRVLATNEAAADYLAALKPYSGTYLCQVKGENATFWGKNWVHVAVIHSVTNCRPLPN